MNKFLTIAFIVVCAALILSSVFRLLTPQEPTIPLTPFITSNFDGSKTQFSNISFSGDEITLPATLPLVQITNQANAQTITNQIINTYGLIQTSEGFWKSDLGYSMTKNQYTGEYRFFIPQPPTSNTTRLAEQDLISNAEAKLKEILPTTNTPIAVETEYIRYFANSIESYEEVSPVDAGYASIPFSYSFGGYPYRFDKIPYSNFEVGINMDGGVKYISFFPQFFDSQVVSEKTLIPIEEATTNISEQKASITTFQYVNENDIRELNLNSLQQVNLTEIEVQYRLDLSLNMLYPFFAFSGTAVDQNNNQLRVQIITPAVATTTQ